MLGNSVCLPSPASMETEATSTINSTINSTEQQQQQKFNKNNVSKIILSPADKRFISSTLSSLKKNKHSLYFREPVDPVALNCPDYFDIIKQPMDLSTVQSKFNNDQYKTVDAFIDDIRLILDNCHRYNNPHDFVALSGKKLEEVFDRLLLKRPSSTVIVTDSDELMSDDKIRLCNNALIEMNKKKYDRINWAFKQPVDASAWGATDYYDIIKNPMDLSTIERKLNELQYKNEDEFVADVRLMFQNCYTYNAPTHPVHQNAKALEKVFDTYWKKKAHKTSSSSKAKKHHHEISSISASVSSSPQRSVAERPEKVKEAEATISQKRTSDHLDDNRNQNNINYNNNNNANNNNNNNNTNANKKGTILRLKLSVTNHNEPKKEQRPEDQVSPPTPTSSSSIASSSAPSLSLQQPRPLAISKEAPPPQQQSYIQPTKSLALSATKPATNNKSASSFSASYLNNQRRSSDDNNQIPEPRRPEHATKYPSASGKRPAATGKHPAAGKHPAGKHPASKHLPGKRPRQQYSQSTSQATTPISPPPAPAPFDLDSVIGTIRKESNLRTQEVEEQRKANEEKYRAQKQMELRKQQENERQQKEWQERTSKQKKMDRQRRIDQLTATATIDISKHKIACSAFERKLQFDPEWRELVRWQRDTVDYRHFQKPAFIRNRSDKTIADIKSALLSSAIRFREKNQQQNGDDHHTQEREEEEQDMDLE